MVTKISNSVLNLVDPPLDNLVLLEGTFDNVVIGSHVPNQAFFAELTDTSLASPLIGASTGLLSNVYLGAGLAMAGNVLYVVFPPPPTGYGLGLYGSGLYGISGPPPVSPPVSPLPPPVSPPVSPVGVSPVGDGGPVE